MIGAVIVADGRELAVGVVGVVEDVERGATGGVDERLSADSVPVGCGRAPASENSRKLQRVAPTSAGLADRAR
jgi:hypothetical protein